MKKFTYGIGASWIFAFPARPVDEFGKRQMTWRKVKYTVTGCRLYGRTEFYSIRVEETGKPVHEIEQSASRLRYLINFNAEEVISDGVRADYPLTAEDVSQYYQAKNAERIAENRRARYMLEKHKGYQEIKAKKARAEMLAGKAEAECEFDKAAAIGAQVMALDEALKKIREDLGITDDVLMLKYDCPRCHDSGILPSGAVCECAHAYENEIRAYIAQELGEVGA